MTSDKMSTIFEPSRQPWMIKCSSMFSSLGEFKTAQEATNKLNKIAIDSKQREFRFVLKKSNGNYCVGSLSFEACKGIIRPTDEIPPNKASVLAQMTFLLSIDEFKGAEIVTLYDTSAQIRFTDEFGKLKLK